MESTGADVIIERLRRARQQNPKSLHDREAAQLAALCLRLPESKLDDEQPAGRLTGTGRLVEARQIRKFNPQLLLLLLALPPLGSGETLTFETLKSGGGCPR